MTGVEIFSRTEWNCTHGEDDSDHMDVCVPCFIAAIDAALRAERERCIGVMAQYAANTHVPGAFNEAVKDIRESTP